MKFEIEIPDQTLQIIAEKAIEDQFKNNQYSTDIGYKLKGLIEGAVKQSINKNFAQFDTIIENKIKERIDIVINEIVSQRLENRVKQVLASQLKQRSIAD